MSAPTSPLGYGLYFIDVLACLLFCITLALASARFGYEESVAVDLPHMERVAGSGAALTDQHVSLRTRDGALELFLDDEPVTLEELDARLVAAPPPSLRVRAEASPLTRVIAIAHAAGVRDIQLAYETRAEPGGKP